MSLNTVFFQKYNLNARSLSCSRSGCHCMSYVMDTKSLNAWLMKQFVFTSYSYLKTLSGEPKSVRVLEWLRFLDRGGVLIAGQRLTAVDDVRSASLCCAHCLPRVWSSLCSLCTACFILSSVPVCLSSYTFIPDQLLLQIGTTITIVSLESKSWNVNYSTTINKYACW